MWLINKFCHVPSWLIDKLHVIFLMKKMTNWWVFSLRWLSNLAIFSWLSNFAFSSCNFCYSFYGWLSNFMVLCNGLMQCMICSLFLIKYFYTSMHGQLRNSDFFYVVNWQTSWYFSHDKLTNFSIFYLWLHNEIYDLFFLAIDY